MKSKTEKYSEWRILNISNFRNLGVYAGDDEKSEDRSFLKLNRSLEKDEIGNLVILTGLNNSGKSNVLSAIEKWKNKNCDKNDEPDFVVKKCKPLLEMNVANGKSDFIMTSIELFDYIRNNEKKLIDNYIAKGYGQYEKSRGMVNILENNISSMVNILENNILNDESGVLNKNNIIINFINVNLEIIEKDIPYAGEFVEIYEKYDATQIRNFLISKQAKDSDKKSILKQNVYRYKQTHINNTDLRCRGTEPNNFFKTILSIMNTRYEDYIEMYKNSLNNKGLRNLFQKQCNEKLLELSEDFNDLFTSDPENKYVFELQLETDYVYFTITRGNVPMSNLDRQSEGFRWTFDFFVNFLKKETFSSGDIVLIDEFGNNLNPMSIKMVTAKLRDIAQKSGLTFVIATQNFMMIDTKHLDEVRLVVNQPNGNTKILNEFDQFQHENHDVLKPLLDALTVNRHFLVDYEQNTVFVEGVSDYFYLTAFSEYFKTKGKDMKILFFPINGVGRTINDAKTTAEELKRIDKNPIVLVDGDAAGKNFQKHCKDKGGITSVFSLDELVGKDVILIEDMFTKDEREKFCLDEKSFDRGATFNQHFEKYVEQCSQETKKRFEKLIKNLIVG